MTRSWRGPALLGLAVLAAALVVRLSGGGPWSNESGQADKAGDAGSERRASAPLVYTALPAAERRSGTDFLTEETRALQADSFANPGYFWVDAGDALFHGAPEGMAGAESCATCHGTGGAALAGVAARYPTADPETGALTNLETQINACRTRHQGAGALAYESEDLLALTAFISHLSRGEPVTVDVGEDLRAAWELGRDYFHQRKGQLDLACSQCHTDRWGQQLRGDTISQGHGNGFPAYRLEWQTLGSLHRRFRDCDVGVRAEPHPLGSETYLALELYLASRAEGLPLESPAVRR